jgi:hypothetical protein
MKGMYLRTGKFGNFFYRDGHETMVSLMVTLFSEKMLISTKCIRGFMPNLIKKSVTVFKLDKLLVLPI